MLYYEKEIVAIRCHHDFVLLRSNSQEGQIVLRVQIADACSRLDGQLWTTTRRGFEFEETWFGDGVRNIAGDSKLLFVDLFDYIDCQMRVRQNCL